MRVLLVIFFLFCSPVLMAEEFIGVESDSSDGPGEGQSAEDGALEEAPPSKNQESSRAPDESEFEQRESAENPGEWNFSLSGGSSSQSRIGLNAGVSYSNNKWTSYLLSGNYDRFESSTAPHIAENYGAALYFVGQIPNPTIIKPSAGAGPGFVQWKREESGVAFSESSSVTLNSFWGFALLFTKHFGLNLQRRWIMYLGDSPALFEDHDLSESKSSVSNTFGFFAYF